MQDVSLDSEAEKNQRIRPGVVIQTENNLSSGNHNNFSSSNICYLFLFILNKKSLLPDKRRAGIRLQAEDLMYMKPLSNEDADGHQEERLKQIQVQEQQKKETFAQQHQFLGISGLAVGNHRQEELPDSSPHFLKLPQKNQNLSFLRQQTGDIREGEVSEGEVDVDEQIEKYTFDETKSKIKDSKFLILKLENFSITFHTFMDLKNKAVKESFDSPIGGRILIPKESKKKVSGVVGPSSD